MVYFVLVIRMCCIKHSQIHMLQWFCGLRHKALLERALTMAQTMQPVDLLCGLRGYVFPLRRLLQFHLFILDFCLVWPYYWVIKFWFVVPQPIFNCTPGWLKKRVIFLNFPYWGILPSFLYSVHVFILFQKNSLSSWRPWSGSGSFSDVYNYVAHRCKW